MIDVEKALALVLSEFHGCASESIALDEALGRYLSKAIDAPFSLPSFRQSAMDGYALIWDPARSTYNVIGEVAAGSADNPGLQAGECVRIYTGAPVPDQADTVVMQEWTKGVKDIRITRPDDVNVGQHIRPIGEQIAQGERCMEAGTKLNAAGMSYLRSFGLTHVEVSKQPLISLLLTGDELVEPGQDLAHGQIYESNSTAIRNALIFNDFNASILQKVEDDAEATRAHIAHLLDQSDVLLISGGISVGDRDHVYGALQQLGVQEVFYKVKQKPGKPFFFGRKETTAVFALPGNPASALTCLYTYVLPHLRSMSGAQQPLGTRIELPLATPYKVKGDRAVFLKGQIKNNRIHVMDAQASSMLRSFALADGLIYVPAGTGTLEAGDPVQMLLIR